MLKQLKVYYIFILMPFVLMLAGAAVYADVIMLTLSRNPHPQINYTIFFIIVVGGGLVVRSLRRLMQEAKALSEFSSAIRSGTDLETLQKMAIGFDGDISYVLRMIAASGSRSISHQEQTAIEHELTKATNRMTRRNALPQYLTGLLVGMGLVGTFIGLLSTLNDISSLISSFADIDISAANPLTVFRNMIEKMKAPMTSMGIAFSASLFGLLGSIVLGLMMVGIRRLQGDIISLLGSEVAQHIEFALAHEGFTYSKGALKLGLNQLGRDTITSRDVMARPVQPISGPLQGVPVAGAVVADGVAADAQPLDDMAGMQDAGSGEYVQPMAGGTAATGLFMGDEARILMRIEERLAETSRLQSRALNTEMDDFRKQRADMLRTLTEHTEASNNFRSELQRVGRQLGSILSVMEKGNVDVVAEMSELTVRLAGDFTESHRIMQAQVEEQRRLNERLEQVLSGK